MKTMYKCNACGATHESWYDAALCHPDVVEVTIETNRWIYTPPGSKLMPPMKSKGLTDDQEVVTEWK